MKNLIITITICFCLVIFVGKTFSQTYDPYAVEVINNLIYNNGFSATPNDPESWHWFTTWNSESPKQLIEILFDWESLTGVASFKDLKKLEKVRCYLCHLSGLDVSGCTNLQSLICFGNYITQLDLSDCTNLNYLNCNSNRLTSIDLSGLPALDSANAIISGQTPLELTLVSNGLGAYCYLIPLNNPWFESSAITYSDGVLISTNRQVLKSNFEVETGLGNLKMTGTMSFAYIGDPPVITTNSVPKGKVDLAYNYSLHATGDIPLNWSLLNGSLPFGLQLSNSGAITGIPTEFGTFTFTAKATNLYGTDTKEFDLEVSSVGIEEVFPNGLCVYPNPTTGELKMENGKWKIENVEIFDVYGKNLINFQLSTFNSLLKIDISHLSNGLYFVKITTSVGKVVKKIVKQ